MTFSVNYQKRKNINLFNKFQSNKNIHLSNVQNYIPIYDRFFALNNTNFNSVNLNHNWSIFDIKDSKNKEKDSVLQHVFTCKLKNCLDDDLTISQQVFFKMAPLLDPFKFLVGKYNHTDTQLFNLPNIDKSIKIHPKMADHNNSSYVDGFFSFLTSKLLHEHKFIHGLDYFGSFLAIKNDYKLNIIDDIDYLIQSDFFNKQQNILFEVEDYKHLIIHPEIKPLQPLKISSSLKSHSSNLSIKSFDESIFENIFENDTLHSSSHLSLNDLKNIDIVDITNSNEFHNLHDKSSNTLKSGSTCSSRTSHTNDNELSDNGLDNLNGEDVNNIDNEDMNDASDYESVDSSNTSISDNNFEEEVLMVTLPKFPVHVICLEHCENTFDDLIMNGNISQDEWFSALMQIIMILITYQKTFSFTHNDLHTNNIMYISTHKKFLYYTFKKKTYKVPTYGKIYKIIDFGRAIYKLNGKIFCSDSFQTGGDAATQYNTEPYFNDKKPRLEPNFSFDLCRLACSIFDYIVDDFDMIKNPTTLQNDCTPIVKLIVDWCIDDNGINVLYKNNGVERYPDFKLYKMISRYVHNHTPIAQLERKEFSKFVISNKTIPNGESVMNIDELPCYV